MAQITDHQLDHIKATHAQRTQEIKPEGLGLWRTNATTNDFAAPIGVGGDSYYGGDRDDPAALMLFDIGGRPSPQ